MRFFSSYLKISKRSPTFIKIVFSIGVALIHELSTALTSRPPILSYTNIKKKKEKKKEIENYNFEK